MVIRENGHYPARFFKDFMLVAAALQQPRQSNIYTGANSPWSISEKTGITYPLLIKFWNHCPLQCSFGAKG